MKKRMVCLRSSVLFGLVFLFGLSLVGTFLSGEVFAQTRPSLVKDVENPDKQITLDQSIIVVLHATEAGDWSCSNVVPSGKRWVIEHVSAIAYMPTEGQMPLLRLYSPEQYIPLTYQGGAFPHLYNYVWLGSQPMKLRLDAGHTPCAEFHRANGTTGQAQVTVNFSGYQIDYP